MAKDYLTQFTWFLTVAEERSFTRAAARLGVSQSNLSHAIKRLEENLGIRLLNRTTRSVSTTDAGARLCRTLSPRFAEIETEIAKVMSLRDRPAGKIRLTVSDHAMRGIVWPKLKHVIKKYPELKLEFVVDNTLSNIMEEGFDAGVRLGESVEADMISVRIGPDWRLVAVASPDYIMRHGRPEHPKDLLQHNCINHRHIGSSNLYPWEFEKDGEELAVKVDGQLAFSGSLAMFDAVMEGMGIGFVPEDVIQPELASGELILLLDDWSVPFTGYHLFFPSRQQDLPAFRVVVDALKHR